MGMRLEFLRRWNGAEKKKTKEIFLNKKSKQQKAQLKFNYEVIESNLGMYGLELHACVSTF